MIQQSLMPADLTAGERLAYRQGWDKRAAKYAAEHGPAPVDGAVAFYADREPVLHKAAMAAVAGLRRRLGRAA